MMLCPGSSTNPSQLWTQNGPQTGTHGCAAQASEYELAKNKSLSSKQLLLISLAGENSQPRLLLCCSLRGVPQLSLMLARRLLALTRDDKVCYSESS